MTLFKKISLLIAFLYVGMLLSGLLISMHSQRADLQETLNVEAEEMAVVLAAALSDPVQSRDQGSLEVMINALFRLGQYESIRLLDSGGNPVVSRTMPKKIEGVPVWFVEWVQLQVMLGKAHIVRGEAGSSKLTLELKRHYGDAYLALWHDLQRDLLWFLGVGGALLVLTILCIRRVLKPLKLLESQAQAISERAFSLRTEVPDTRELKQIVMAMNGMSERLTSIFDEQVALIDQIREHVHVDPVTGMGSRAYFYSRFFANAETSGELMLGAVLVLSLKEYEHYKERYGQVAGELLLKQVAGRWLKVLEEVQDSLIARRCETDFIAWLPKTTSDEAEYYLQAVFGAVSALPLFAQEEKQNFFHIGLAYCETGIGSKVLLEMADEALRTAQSKGVNGTHFNQAQSNQAKGTARRDEVCKGERRKGAHSALAYMNGLSQSEWRKVLISPSESRGLRFYSQPVLQASDRSVLSREVLLRVALKGEMYSANLFIPLIERYGLQQAFDQSVILYMIEFLRGQPASTDVYTINLSPHTLQIEGFIDWLLNTLMANPGTADRLIFELSEHSLSFLIAKIQTLATGLRRLGGRVSLDRFGTGSKAFSYLGTLPLYAIKIDYSYIRQLSSNSDYQFFIKSLLRVAHSRDILVLAGNVETAQQWALLKSLGVDGGKGYFLSRPSEIDAESLQNPTTIVDNTLTHVLAS